MLRTKVVNISNSEYTVYIGRGSKWGNPFKINEDGSRTEVIEKYRKYILQNKKLYDSITELEGEILGCHCKPLDCHGDVLVKLLKDKPLRDLAEY